MKKVETVEKHSPSIQDFTCNNKYILTKGETLLLHKKKKEKHCCSAKKKEKH
jgi:hypothetical protein